MPGALWVWVEAQVAGPGPLSGSRLLAAFVIGAPARRWSCCRGARPELLAVAVLAVLLVTSALAWERLIDAPEDAVFAGGLERSWIDDARARGRTRDEALHRHRLRLGAHPPRALPHRGLQRAPSTAPPTSATRLPDGLPIERVDVGTGRSACCCRPGDAARWPTTSSPSPASSSRASESRRARTPSLVLWRTDGPVRVVGAERSNAERQRRATAPSARGAGSRSG